MNTHLKENIQFFNFWAARYDRPLFQFWMKRFHAPILQELYNQRDVKILDLSCGTGQLLYSLYHQNKGKISLQGADISDNMLTIARKRLPPSVILRRADIHALPFSNNTFDYVVSTEAFHHYYNQSKALAEMKRVTKKRGKIIVVDVNFFVRPIHWLFQKLEPGGAKINSRREMCVLFQQAGLTSISQQRIFLFAVATTGAKK